ncbi:von Willebrand factor A domain-containing protein 3B-like [Polyodon spathula]|uniref:von Willebrand factor A domain-containing protein 3B-like n=1 Tax=Polyodon spathula TaxID=7913 RepID=UPI001B7EF98D|nr:von Willebrand factor A domain-containing protein 3B-like [Polyodon spathula]
MAEVSFDEGGKLGLHAFSQGNQETVPRIGFRNKDASFELDACTLISSSKWLRLHGLKESRLQLSQILSQIGFKHREEYISSLRKPVSSQYAEGLFSQFTKNGQMYNLTASRDQLSEFVASLMRRMKLYKQRLDWLTSGSRQMFGVIQEHSVALVLDFGSVSKAQFDLCCDVLCAVLREQVAHIATFHLIRAAAEMEMYHEKAVHSTRATIDSAVGWIRNLEHKPWSSQSRAVEAVLKAMSNKTVEAVYLFAAGDFKEAMVDLLTAFPSLCPVHTVSFNAKHEGTIKLLKNLAHLTAGRFHAFAEMFDYTEDALCIAGGESGVHGSALQTLRRPVGGLPPGAGVREDVFLIWREMEEARNTLQHVQALVLEVPQPIGGHEAMISKHPDMPKSEDCMSSRDWLQKYGLKAQKLLFYDALGDCAFPHSDGVVDVKSKPADESLHTDAEKRDKLVNAKYCDRFAHTKWRDGSVVHMYITAEKCKWYEGRMKTALNHLQKRLDWLQTGSRELFGTVLEDQVYVLIDTSESMKDKLPTVKDKILQLMQEQLRHKSKVNFVRFDSRAVAWRDRLAEVSEQNLENAWLWVKGFKVGGSTNTLGALRLALADPGTHAVYLLSDGRPDQPPKTILAQMHLHPPVPIHSISFHCADLEASRFLHELSEETGGRFHCYQCDITEPQAPQPFVVTVFTGIRAGYRYCMHCSYQYCLSCSYQSTVCPVVIRTVCSVHRGGCPCSFCPSVHVVLSSEDTYLLKKEMEQGKQDLDKVLKLQAECVILDWYHNGDEQIQNRNQERPHSASMLQSSSEDLEVTKRALSALPWTPASHHSHRDRDQTHRSKDLQRQKLRHAAYTRSSLLRFLSNGVGISGKDSALHEWMLPETQQIFKRNLAKQNQVLNGLHLTANKQIQKKAKCKPKESLDMSSARWLKTNGLVARRLTIMDALAPTAVPQTAKYIPILDKHVCSKVFDEILPLAHVSNSKTRITLVNPQAVNLEVYKEKLKQALKAYERRLNGIVWRALTQEERDKFDSTEPVPFKEHKEALLQALDRLGWPIPEESLSVLEGEIETGQAYLQQASDLQNLALETHSQSQEGNTAEEKIQGSNVFRASAGEKRVLDTLRGQRAIARAEADGFYYPGTVTKCIGSKKAIVSFSNGDTQITPLGLLIPIGGALPCPPLQVGDFVFVRSGTDCAGECYVPGIVIATPQRGKSTDKFYMVLKYNNKQEVLLRSGIVKTSQTRYALACRYIRECQMISHTMPPAQTEQPARRALVRESTKEAMTPLKATQRFHGWDMRKCPCVNILPLAHVSNSKTRITLVNPQAVNLEVYKEKLKQALKAYERRLNGIVWRALTQEERDKFDSTEPVPFKEHKEALLQALDRLGWPIPEESLSVLEGEIETGQAYLQQASDLQNLALETHSQSQEGNTAEEKIQGSNVFRASAGEKRVLDTLRGQRAIARAEADGFYYPGTVTKCIGSKKAIVSFSNGDTQITPLGLLIPIGGALPCPPLQVGDFVFVRSGTDCAGECYVPGIVIATPQRGKSTDKFYMVLKYNNKQEVLLRSGIVKTSQTRYALACRYIRECQMISHTIPSVQSVKPFLKDSKQQKEKGKDPSEEQGGDPKKEKRRRERREQKACQDSSDSEETAVSKHDPGSASRDEACTEEKSNGDYERERAGTPPRASRAVSCVLQSKLHSRTSSLESGRLSTPLSSRHSEVLTAPSAQPASSEQSDNSARRIRKLEDWAEELEQALTEHREQQELIQKHVKDLVSWKIHEDADILDNQKQLAQQQQELLERLTKQRPLTSSSANRRHDERGAGTFEDIPEYVKIARRSLPNLTPGEKPLARWSLDGWYSPGSVIHSCGDQSYFVQNNEGELERIWREDLITDTEDAESIIQLGDPVIGLHQLYPHSYCPGAVLRVMPDLKLEVRYYDGTEALVPRDQAYLISTQKFERDVAYLLECEARWVGQPVVARDNRSGTYHLGEVLERVGDGKHYVILWADGSTAVQSAAFIFGKFTRSRTLTLGDRVLTLAEPASLTYLPGVIRGFNGTKLVVSFCSGKSGWHVEPQHCFWLSGEQFNEAVHMYNRKQAEHEEEEGSETDEAEGSGSGDSRVSSSASSH